MLQKLLRVPGGAGNAKILHRFRLPAAPLVKAQAAEAEAAQRTQKVLLPGGVPAPAVNPEKGRALPDVKIRNLRPVRGDKAAPQPFFRCCFHNRLLSAFGNIYPACSSGVLYSFTASRSSSQMSAAPWASRLERPNAP